MMSLLAMGRTRERTRGHLMYRSCSMAMEQSVCHIQSPAVEQARGRML